MSDDRDKAARKDDVSTRVSVYAFVLAGRLLKRYKMLYITACLYALMVPITKRTPGEKRSARVRNQFALFNKRGARTARNARRDDPRVRAARTVRFRDPNANAFHQRDAVSGSII